jgi:hypothetical protein
MSLKSVLKSRPVIYEIVPPRRDPSRYSTELGGIEAVLHDKRIAAINIPELINRRLERGKVVYSPATIPPEEYAMMIRDYKEPIVNLIVPRMERGAFLGRAEKILLEYEIPNLVLVGKERREDALPGLSVVEALRLLSHGAGRRAALGGICIFSRASSGTDERGVGVGALPEHRRVFQKAEAGGDFVTSQITFEAAPAVEFLVAYQSLCRRTGRRPITVFVSIATVPTPSILALLESLDVQVPPRVRKKLLGSGNMGRESVGVAGKVFAEIVEESERKRIEVPLGLQIEQVGVNSGDLSLQLLDDAYPLIRR